MKRVCDAHLQDTVEEARVARIHEAANGRSHASGCASTTSATRVQKKRWKKKNKILFIEANQSYCCCHWSCLVEKVVLDKTSCVGVMCEKLAIKKKHFDHTAIIPMVGAAGFAATTGAGVGCIFMPRSGSRFANAARVNQQKQNKEHQSHTRRFGLLWWCCSDHGRRRLSSRGSAIRGIASRSRSSGCRHEELVRRNGCKVEALQLHRLSSSVVSIRGSGGVSRRDGGWEERLLSLRLRLCWNDDGCLMLWLHISCLRWSGGRRHHISTSWSRGDCHGWRRCCCIELRRCSDGGRSIIHS